jgi:hypothetical protein
VCIGVLLRGPLAAFQQASAPKSPRSAATRRLAASACRRCLLRQVLQLLPLLLVLLELLLLQWRLRCVLLVACGLLLAAGCWLLRERLAKQATR